MSIEEGFRPRPQMPFQTRSSVCVGRAPHWNTWLPHWAKNIEGPSGQDRLLLAHHKRGH